MAETESKSIHKDDATLDQNAMKLTKTCGLEFGSLLWRHLTLQRKPQHGCTTTVSRVKQPKDNLEILHPYDFWCAQTCLFRAIFGLCVRSL